MEFIKGDRVKILSHSKHPSTGSGIYWDNLANGNHENAVGKIGFYSDGSVFERLGREGEYYGRFDDRELELVNKGRPVYVVFYEVNEIDPMKTFSTDKELKEWLAEAKDNKDIDFSSIRVFEVKKELKVKTSFKLVG